MTIPLVILWKLIRVTLCLNSESRNVKLTPTPKLSSKNENSVIVSSLWNVVVNKTFQEQNGRTAEFSKTTEVYGDLF